MKAKSDSESDSICSLLDVGYSYNLALDLERFKTHESFGFRTAGSRAEADAGDMLYREMQSIGLSAVKDEITVDGWEFKHATLEYYDGTAVRTFQLGAYQTDFITDGFEEFTLVNAGRGTAADFDKIDANGKICLVFINQRDEWWINYPAYQAYLRGARAVIAVQNSGFGEVNSNSLNAQDICGPSAAAAFSASKKDAKKLLTAAAAEGKEIKVRINAHSAVTPKCKTYNITGVLRGKSDSMIMVSAHYDSYFKGFQDDNTGVSMMLSMARALVKSETVPNMTIVFVAFAAEEWGTIDSRYDWSAGAYAFLNTSHYEWKNKITADINLELPAFSHGSKHYIRCVYEYKSYLKKFVASLPKEVRALYPKGVSVVCPVQSWSDDFALSCAGIPSMVNEFKLSSFMETHYHSQFDNDNSYNERVYYFHHQLYMRLLLALDSCEIVPVNFGTRFRELEEGLTDGSLSLAVEGDFRKAALEARTAGKRLYRKIKKVNSDKVKTSASAKEIRLERSILRIFKACEKRFVSLDWYERSVFPYANAQANVRLLNTACCKVYTGDFKGAVATLVEIDDNSYAEVFDRTVVKYFTSRAQIEDKEVTKWGTGKLKYSGHIDLFDVIAKLKTGDIKYKPRILEHLQALQRSEHKRLEEILGALTGDLLETKGEIENIITLIES